MSSLSIRFIDHNTNVETSRGFSNVSQIRVDTAPNGRLEVRFEYESGGDTRFETYTNVTWYRETD